MRHFILVETLQDGHHSIPVDQIKYVCRNIKYEGLISRIELMDGTGIFSTESSKDIHRKIKDAQGW